MKVLRNHIKPKEKSVFSGETDLTFGCDRFISSPVGHLNMAKVREARSLVVKQSIQYQAKSNTG